MTNDTGKLNQTDAARAGMVGVEHMKRDAFVSGVPRDPAFVAGWLRGIANSKRHNLCADDVQAIAYASELLIEQMRALEPDE